MASHPWGCRGFVGQVRSLAVLASLLVTSCGSSANEPSEALGSTEHALGEGLKVDARLYTQGIQIQIVNTTADPVPLNALELRVYVDIQDDATTKWGSYYCGITPSYASPPVTVVVSPYSSQAGFDHVVSLTFSTTTPVAAGQSLLDCQALPESSHDPAEDWSLYGLTANYAQTDRVQLLVDGQLVWGERPKCSQDSACYAGAFCNSEQLCVPRKPQGSACDASLCAGASCQVCEDGVPCADGFCCDAPCSGACEACAEALTGLPNGTCAPIPADEDPKDQCPLDLDYPASCGADGLCDGARQCRAHAKTGTACGDTECSNSEVSGFLCDGKGKCHEDVEGCAPYACSGVACASSCEKDDDCDRSVAYCVDGHCESTLDLGIACSEPHECGSGVCSDGVCCEHACDGQCEACAESGQEGSCVAVSGEPRGERRACVTGVATCAGSCDGREVTRCSYPNEDAVCASECSSEREIVSVCDGAGECDAKPPRACGGYACDDDSCRSSCSKARDCAADFRCQAGECVPSTAKCSDDGESSIPSDAEPVDCAPFLCDTTSGACADSCDSSADCVGNAICGGDRACVPAPKRADDDGCSVSAARPQPMGAGLLLGLLLGGCWRRSRSGESRRRS